MVSANRHSATSGRCRWTATGKPFPVWSTPFNETNAQFSPDGQWIAYQSNESGPVEIYVQPFPGPGRKTRDLQWGGVQVRWRQDGKELFYLAPDNRLMAVPIRLDAARQTVDVGKPVPLFARSSPASRRATSRATTWCLPMGSGS